MWLNFNGEVVYSEFEKIGHGSKSSSKITMLRRVLHHESFEFLTSFSTSSIFFSHQNSVKICSIVCRKRFEIVSEKLLTSNFLRKVKWFYNYLNYAGIYMCAWPWVHSRNVINLQMLLFVNKISVSLMLLSNEADKYRRQESEKCFHLMDISTGIMLYEA